MTSSATELVIPFESEAATLATVGGKGMNLARLTRAGFPVPRGFLLSTEAYRVYVAANQLEPIIRAALAGVTAEEAPALERASAAIRSAFAAGALPADLAALLQTEYARFGGGPVAVRSSATAEDLPDMSFAGQQDTYLNVIGAEPLLEAVIGCWSSLWTARAIGYRLRNRLPQTEVALAVVVQTLVASEISGVLFTANPLTGLLSETVINATFGLGEALVSGQVEPDQFIVDTASGRITQKMVGAKQVATRAQSAGGVATLAMPAGAAPTLSDEQLRQLTALGQRVQLEYSAPQDIEWAFADGQWHLLQARAITSLFPVPQVSFDPLMVWFSFGAVQGLVGPMTPLGRDSIQRLVASLSVRFGQPLTNVARAFIPAAGERLWIKVSDVLRHPLGSRLAGPLLGFIEPSVGQILKPLAADPRLGAGTGRFKFSTLRHAAGFFLPIAAAALRTVLWPERTRANLETIITSYLATAQLAPASDRFGRLASVVTFMRERQANAFAFILPKFISAFVPSIAALNVLLEMAGAQHRALALAVTRGLPHNVTTEMDLALWSVATALQAEPAAADEFHRLDAETLAARYQRGELPPGAQAALAGFLGRYGARGVGEFDLGQPRWRDTPAPVIQTLQSYLNLDAAHAPDTVFANGAQAAQAALEELARLARAQRGGWLKEKIVRGAARRVRLLMGIRESPKFFAIRMMGIAHAGLLSVGAEFAAAGTLDHPEDLFFLDLAELEALAQRVDRDWRALVAERRAVSARELRRRQVPRVLVSDGRAFYEGLGAATDTGAQLTGNPVSPGVVEGRVHVVLDPRGAQLSPGEILVCPGTDPAWTPLFMTAGGLITEVGGLMTHGSVVAREYGIPAVVGVDRATQRLTTGQRLRLDGTTGQITLLNEAQP